MICALINIFKKAVTGIMVLRVTDLLRNGHIPTIEDIRVTLFTMMCVRGRLTSSSDLGDKVMGYSSDECHLNLLTNIVPPAMKTEGTYV